MNTETPPAPSRIPFFRRCWRAMCSRKMLYALIVLATLIALFYAEENFRGRRAWENYREDAEARGLKLDLAAHIPPPIPEAENGANTPFIQSWFIRPKGDDTNAVAEWRRQDTNQWPAKYSEASAGITIKRRTTGSGSQDDRFFTDLVAWQQSFARLKEPKDKNAQPIIRNSHGLDLDAPEQAKAAVVVLEELKAYEPALAELRAMSTRSKIRYPVTYKLDEPFTTLLPHLGKIKGILQTLSLQASAELATGQTNQAFANVKLMLWFCDSVEHEPFLISQLVRIAGRQIVLQPVWEGLARHQWSDAQLKEMQELFLRTDFASSLDRGLAAERAGVLTFVQRARKQKKLGDTMAAAFGTEDGSLVHPGNQAAVNVAGWFVPRGWFYFEMANLGAVQDGQFKDAWDSDSKVFYPQTIAENERWMQENFARDWELGILHHRCFARLLVPLLGRSAGRFARAQSTAHQAALACALERHWLKHGSYPESLAALVPAYLAKIPHEVVSNEPMHYRRTDDGYVLYSIGWDGKDDGGKFIEPNKLTEQGDWVWRSAP